MPDLVDAFRRSVEAFNRRDLDMTASIYAPDVVWDGTEMGIGRFDGRAAFRAFLEDWLAAYDEVKVDAEEVLDLGNGVAFAILHQNARLIASEGYINQRDGWAFLWEHGLIVQVTVYPERDIDKAHAAAERIAESREQAMSQEPRTSDLVELTHRQFEAGSRGDLDAVLSLCAPDAVWEAASLGTSFEGVAAIRGFLEDWLGAYEEFGMEPEEILDLGNGVVFAVIRLTGRPAGSPDSALMRRRPLVFIWVEGLVAQVTAPSSDIVEARAAAERLAESKG